MSEAEMPTNYARRVGERLRLIRKQKGLSLQEVEASSSQEFKASVLGAYERGERAISVPRLQRLAKFYAVPVDQLLPQDVDAYPALRDDEVIEVTAAEAESGEATPARGSRRFEDERVSIDLTRLQALAAQEREMLTRYLGMIQVQRQDFNGKVLTIRNEDLRAIACLFETTTDSMRRRLDELGLRR
ncbi:MAG TPA: transcriptional regulator [Acidimicrobiales bacterium]|nr:transcriptional regulator [Acidimicrobiales bacterium]